MRLFIAAEPPEEIRARIEQIGKSLLSAGADIKPVAGENIHVTLKFLGEVDEGMEEAICSGIRSIAACFPEFHASASGVGYFGKGDRINTVISPISAGREKLSEIMHSLENHFSGILKENRAPNPHLTIARVRSGRNIECLKALIDELGAVNIGEFSVKELLLKKSTLNPSGPEYETVSTFPLPTNK